MLPECKPENAELSESEVVVKAIDWAKKKSDDMVIIHLIAFDDNARVGKLKLHKGENNSNIK